jgi:cyclophilin family peptidyl-prolyl cis-trans isomerase
MNKLYIAGGVLLAVFIGGFLVFSNSSNQQQDSAEENNNITVSTANMTAILKTNLGDVKIEFFSDDAPKTVENFTNLAKDGFYDGIKFHRVIPGFMIQGGDPLTKDDSRQAEWGTGDPGYKFADEIHANNKNNTGTVAMANAGPNTNGSQFFINVADNNSLDQKHTVFGKVVEGMDVVNAISNVATEGPDRPVDAVIIESITVENN